MLFWQVNMTIKGKNRLHGVSYITERFSVLFALFVLFVAFCINLSIFVEWRCEYACKDSRGII